MSAITINTNVPARNALRRLGQSTGDLRRVFERLSSGMRINHAGDDAAGLSVAAGLEVDRRVYAQGLRNINDGVSYLSVADGALSQMSAILTRLGELSEQSANGVYSNNQRGPLDRELNALAAEYNRIIQITEFNGKQVFSPSNTTLTVQAGYGDRGSLAVTL